MSDLFKEILPSITTHNRPIDFNPKDYNPFLVNKALSYNMDTILYAQEMNQRKMPVDMQYEYLKRSIKKYRRPYQPWVKNKADKPSPEFLAVQETYDTNENKTREILNTLTKDQIDLIVKRTYKGGVIPCQSTQPKT